MKRKEVEGPVWIVLICWTGQDYKHCVVNALQELCNLAQLYYLALSYPTPTHLLASTSLCSSHTSLLAFSQYCTYSSLRIFELSLHRYILGQIHHLNKF